MFCQLTLQMPLFCACHYLEDFSLRRCDRAGENGASVSLPSLLPPQTRGMPKPLCNLEGIFILPQGQHVFSPWQPHCPSSSICKKNKPDKPRKNSLVWQATAPEKWKFTGQQGCPRSATENVGVNFWPSNDINNNPKPPQHRCDGRAMEQRRPLWKYDTGSWKMLLLAGERGKKCFINARSRIMQQKGEIFSLSGRVKFTCSSLAHSLLFTFSHLMYLSTLLARFKGINNR